MELVSTCRHGAAWLVRRWASADAACLLLTVSSSSSVWKLVVSVSPIRGVAARTTLFIHGVWLTLRPAAAPINPSLIQALPEHHLPGAPLTELVPQPTLFLKPGRPLSIEVDATLLGPGKHLLLEQVAGRNSNEPLLHVGGPV
jgi:hypothetical protein